MSAQLASAALLLGLACPAAAQTLEIELGKQLFFDRRLSKTEQVSCSSCHNLPGNGSDGRPTSFGIRNQLGKRHAPTVWNAGDKRVLFWDGRASSLEEQAAGPLVNPVEMGMPSYDAVVRRLGMIPSYVAEFNAVYPGSGLTMTNVVTAIAAFERTLVTAPQGVAPGHLYSTFAKVGCTSCHNENLYGGAAPLFVRFPLYRTSRTLAYHLEDDKGRFEVTNDPQDMNVWRVPSLRNVALTGPYFHNGSVIDLAEAVRVMAESQLGKRISEGEVGKIVQYLRSLTERFPPVSQPVLPPD